MTCSRFTYMNIKSSARKYSIKDIQKNNNFNLCICSYLLYNAIFSLLFG